MLFENGWKEIEGEFANRWKFSHAVGPADGKHVAIIKPKGSGSLYYNYKKFCSKILFAFVKSK